MLLKRLYYLLKPALPLRLRIGMRRMYARRQRRMNQATWPINPGSDKKPANWEGWPDGKQFAFVLTHDVERQKGLSRCQQLMRLHADLGFRSSFNFIPEGEYRVTEALRREIWSNGFEVGVHDLRHDGKLYWSRESFRRQAIEINRYLKDWEAAGFRSGFMLHRLEWLHDLDVVYDASTFDTDPFEPQPDGANTIFPFWVSPPAGACSSNDENRTRPGYVELPYTLVQDFNLFIVLREMGSDLWKRKLDWIAERGGMALLTIHPDYINFGLGSGQPDEFPVQYYKDFLCYVRDRYAGAYWHALPKELAEFAARNLCPVKSGVVPGRE